MVHDENCTELATPHSNSEQSGCRFTDSVPAYGHLHPTATWEVGESERRRDLMTGQKLPSVLSNPRAKAKACSRAEGTSSAHFPYHLLLSPQSNPGTGLRRHKLVPGGISK